MSITPLSTALRIGFNLHLHRLHDTGMMVRYIRGDSRRSRVRRGHDSLRATRIASALIGGRPWPRRPSSCITVVLVQIIRLQIVAALLSEPAAPRARPTVLWQVPAVN